MKLTKSFPFREAYKFASVTFIDNFFTLVKTLLSWLGIIIGALLVLTISWGLLGLILGQMFTLADITHFFNIQTVYSKLFFVLPFFFLFFVLYVVTFETMHFQIIRLAFSCYDKKPLTFSELFTFKNTRFGTYLGARLIYGAKTLLPLLITTPPALIGMAWYFQMGGKERFDLLSPYLKNLIVIGWFALFIISALASFYIMFTYIFTGYSILEGKHTNRHQDASYAATLSQSVKWRIFFALFIVGIFAYKSLLYALAYPFNILVLVYIYKHLQQFVPSEITKP